MVCYPTEGRCECIVRNQDGKNVVEVTLPATKPVSELIQLVADKTGLHLGTVILILQVLEKPDVVLTSRSTGTLGENGLKTELGARNSFFLTRRPPRTADESADSSMRIQLEQSVDSRELEGPRNERKSFDSSRAIDYRSLPSTSSKEPSNQGHKGLVNQAMTCYLNSLLQALFMTPEFRNALYKWKYEGKKHSKSIPYQLQKLFLNLQCSIRHAVETTELTASFGWGTGDVWLQHDVQELCRVMFEALEQEFKNTSQADLINQLYQGKMIDYVKCLECGKEKTRIDTFLDIPLPLRPFKSTVAYTSIMDALKAFVQPEILDDNNQYHCETCQKKCDAHKGLKFSQLPYILTIHLKRFDFDFSSLQRVKLVDRVAFPEKLDLTAFLRHGAGIDNSICDLNSSISDETTDSSSEQGEVEKSEVTEGLEEGRSRANSVKEEVPDGAASVEPAGLPSGDQPMSSEAEVSNPPTHLYDLYAIMVHSGSAGGGHYFVYIKDFTSDSWYCFNDMQVHKATASDIERTFGGVGRGFYASSYSPSVGTAYMLLYRLVDKERNAAPMKKEEFPPHLQALVEELKENEEREQTERARQEETVKVKVYWNGCKSNPMSNQTKVSLHKDEPLSSLLHQAYENLQLETAVPEDQCRLVAYNMSIDQMEYSFEGRESESIGSIMKWLQHNSASNDFLIESKTPNQHFTPYKPNDMRVYVYGVNLENEEIISYDVVQIPVCALISVVKTTLRKVLPHVIPANKEMALFTIETDSDVATPIVRYLADAQRTLTKTIYMSKLFLCALTPQLAIDLESPNPSSLKFLDRIKNIVILNVTLPHISEDTLEKNCIPRMSEHNKLIKNNNKDDMCTGEIGTSNAISSNVPSAMLSNVSAGMPSVVLSGTYSNVPSGTYSNVPSGTYSNVPSGTLSNVTGSNFSNVPSGTLTDEENSSTGCSSQSTSEENSLTDSERTLIGEQSDGQLSPSGSLHQISAENLSANACETNGMLDENWDEGIEPLSSKDLYFHTSKTAENERRIKLVVDRSMDWSTFMNRLEGLVGISCRYLQVVKGSPQDSPCDSNMESVTKLSCVKDLDHLFVHLYRPLLSNEQKFRILYFKPNATQFQFLTDWIVVQGTTVKDNKKDLISYLERHKILNVTYNRCRLRKVFGKTPCKRPLFDHEHWVRVGSCTELLLEELMCDEEVTSAKQALVFIRQWHPSTLKLSPFEQIILDPSIDMAHQISFISDIPTEHLLFAKASNQFPWEVSVLTIHNDLNWYSDTKALSELCLDDDNDASQVILYRDGREEAKVMSMKATASFKQKGDPDISPSKSITSSHRREKPLKIYLEANDSEPASQYDL